MGGVGTLSCLLCSGLLPKEEEEVVEQHMKDHHRVFTNMTLLVASSKLEASQLAVVTKMVVDMGIAKVVVRVWEDAQKRSTHETKNELPKQGLSTVEKVDDGVEIKGGEEEDFGEIKCEIDSDCDEDCSNEGENIPTKKRRNYPKNRKRCLSKNGKIDKLIAESGISLEMGHCVCPMCAKDFLISDTASEKEYRRHVYHHRVSKWDCQCGVVHEKHKHNHPKKFHIYTVHRGTHHCSKCSQTFKEEQMYQDHLEQHSKEVVVSECICDSCGFTAKNQVLLNNHKAYKHDTQVVTCETCGMEFQGRLKMMMHRRRAHINAGKKQCPYCAGSYTNLWRHLKVMHTEDKDKLYTCNYCGKGFVDNDRLKGHIRSRHTGEKPFPCRFDGVFLSVSRNKWHFSISRYLCGQACAEAGNRKKHEITR